MKWLTSLLLLCRNKVSEGKKKKSNSLGNKITFEAEFMLGKQLSNSWDAFIGEQMGGKRKDFAEDSGLTFRAPLWWSVTQRLQKVEVMSGRASEPCMFSVGLHRETGVGLESFCFLFPLILLAILINAVILLILEFFYNFQTFVLLTVL